MQWVFALFVVVAVVERSWAGECDPPKPGDRMTHAWECCKGDLMDNLLPKEFLSKIQKCTGKFPLPDRLPEEEEGPTPEIKEAMACAAECLFAEAELLTRDKKLDKDKITKSFMGLAKDKNWRSVMPKVIDKCFSEYRAEVDTSLKCKSGAKEFEHCLTKESFLECPATFWTDSADCKELKSKISKCPKMPVMMVDPSSLSLS